MKADAKRPKRSSGVLLLTAVLLCILCQPACRRGDDVVVIGSKSFTEQIVLGELVALAVEYSTGLRAERRFNLAGSFLCHQAVQSGEIDLYIEYTGTAYTGILGYPPIHDAAEVLETLRREYAERFDLEWLEPLGFNNSFAIMVRGQDARRLHLSTISDAAPFASQWRAGFGYEFLHRADGFAGLAKVYGLVFADAPSEMDLGLMYRALADGKVDLVAGNSTEGLVSVLDLVILEDDLRYFPPYEAAPVVNRKSLDRIPALRGALLELGGLISEEEMRELNVAVDAENKSARKVALEFLQKKGLL